MIVVTKPGQLTAALSALVPLLTEVITQLRGSLVRLSPSSDVRQAADRTINRIEYFLRQLNPPPEVNDGD